MATKLYILNPYSVYFHGNWASIYTDVYRKAPVKPFWVSQSVSVPRDTGSGLARDLTLGLTL